MSCSTVVIVIGVIGIALLLWACSQSAISKYEREERKYRRWRQKQDRESDSPSHDD